VFHEDGDDNVDEYELCHQYEDDEEDGRNDMIHTAVSYTVSRLITVLAQCILPPTNPQTVRPTTHDPTYCY